jgi:hypothetical protein
MAKKSKKDRRQAQAIAQVKYLSWLIKEYDCYTLEELVKLASTDSVLHRLMRECGHNF